ncbi:hypothetical protein C8R46DRAFT_1027692 [Mycena filopes]|nr:hypothetical protein C8R46DRAFT_1027692 [Mycena filopes]
MTTRKIARGRREVAERFTWRSKKGNESNFAGKVPREREMSRLFQTWSSFQPTPQASIPSVGAVLIGAYFRTKLSRVAVRIYIATYITVNRLLAGARTMASSNLRMLVGAPPAADATGFRNLADDREGISFKRDRGGLILVDVSLKEAVTE